MSDARRSLHSFWFGALSDEPLARLVCGALVLGFLAFPLADLLSGRLSTAGEIAGALGLAAFAGLYLRLFWVLPARGSRLLLGAVGVLAVGLSIALGDEWEGLLVYLSVAFALALPTRAAAAGVLAISAAALAISAEPGLALQALTFGLLVIGLRRLAALVEEVEATRGRAAELAVSEERLRLSRDLHDLLGRNLSVIALKSELARRLLGSDPDAAEREIGDVEAVARQSLEEARAALRGLRRTSQDGELERARDALEAAGIEADVRSDGPLPAEVEEPLGFAAREAVTNVIRHSGASRCELLVRREGRVAELDVRDDGAGRSASPAGSGLRGLAERMAEAGGTLTAGPLPDGGFRLAARVPLDQTGAAREASAATAR